MHDNAQCTNARQCKEITCSCNVWSHKEEWVCAVGLLSTKYSTRIKSKYSPWMSLFARLIGHAKNGWSKSMCRSDRETTINLAFCSLSSKQELPLSLQTFFNQKFLQWSFCSLIVVLMSKTRCSSIIFILLTHPFKGVRKNLLKA